MGPERDVEHAALAQNTVKLSLQIDHYCLPEMAAQAFPRRTGTYDINKAQCNFKRQLDDTYHYGPIAKVGLLYCSLLFYYYSSYGDLYKH